MEILLIVQTILIVVLLALFFIHTKKKSVVNEDPKIAEMIKDLGRLEAVFKDEMSRNRLETSSGQKDIRTEISQNLNSTLNSLTLTVETKLTTLQQDNSKKLDMMRETVDEKLHATLEKRFGESFKLVSDRLDQVHKGLGEMQTIAVGVGDLKKVLSNIKTRGSWGEAQLGNLIEEIMTTEQYGVQVKTKKNSADVVDYAIKLPGQGEKDHIWLPIDAKFPIEDYQRLIEAEEVGDLAAIALNRKQLDTRIREESKKIHTKYIDTPHTTDFGILFVPIESLYGEILRIPGLFEFVRREYKVIITGPTTIQAILNSLNMGFRTLAIQKRSSEVWDILNGVKTEFGKFGDILEKTHKKLQEAGNTIENAMVRSRAIEKKLGKAGDAPGIGEAEIDVKEIVEIE
ncbi:MAG: DNA recombination protein RmuC [Patescibacteria group bacterium]